MKRERTLFEFIVIVATVLLIIGGAVFWSVKERAWIPGTYDGQHLGSPPQRFNLNGTAAGGTLSLCMLNALVPMFASIQTTQGESAISVLQRLAKEINDTDAFCWRTNILGPIWYHGPAPSASIEGTQLLVPGSRRYFFSGTDKGFTIPQPAMSVSGSYDPVRNQILLSWINPPGDYEEIDAAGQRLSPGTTNCVIDCATLSQKNLFSYWWGVMLRRNGMDSPPASIVIRSNSQEELGSFPFYMGIMPNWCGWSSDSTENIVFEQGTKSNVHPKQFIMHPDEKPFYQIIKARNRGIGGIWRRFLGLTPGHTYRVEARLNTLEMDRLTNWVFSLHATPDRPDGNGLTLDQLAGTEVLPNGNLGAMAGCIAVYGPTVTTAGKWELRSTGEVGGLMRDISLPKDVASITVWFRHTAEDSTGVGIDWIKLEDVTTNELRRANQYK